MANPTLWRWCSPQRVIRLGFLLVCLCLTMPAPARAQLWNASEQLQTDAIPRLLLQSGLGWTRLVVNGNPINYAAVSLSPTLSIGKFQAGLNIDLLINTASDPGGSIVRQSELKMGRLIRFVRYGSPSGPTFFHVGALDRASLGHGFIMSRYSNQIADQSRRIGSWVKIDRPGGGVEGIVTNVGSAEIYGGRIFLRPFGFRGDHAILGRLSFGGTILIDDNPGRERTRAPKPSVEVVGLDVELPLIKKERFSLVPYGDFAKILDGGSGGTLGLQLNMAQPTDRAYLSGRLAFQSLGSGFTPAFFDETYEINSILGSGLTKIEQIRGLPGAQGALGELEASLLRRLIVSASYRNYGGRKDSGVFHTEAHLVRLIPNVTFHAVYDKQNIRSFSDIRRLDDRAVVLAEIMYKINRYMSAGLDYRWTFVFDEDPDILTYRPIERIYPKVIFAYAF